MVTVKQANNRGKGEAKGERQWRPGERKIGEILPTSISFTCIGSLGWCCTRDKPLAFVQSLD